jgi:hypothetical protein
MQIVINIDEKIYKRILPYKDVPVISNLCNDYPEITYAIANGVPLPKGHGRLVDADALEKKMCDREEELGDDKALWESSAVSVALNMFAPTIIEADRSEEP